MESLKKSMALFIAFLLFTGSVDAGQHKVCESSWYTTALVTGGTFGVTYLTAPLILGKHTQCSVEK